jgi:hypothetical protein
MAIGFKNTCLISIAFLGGAYWYIVLISFGGKKEKKTQGRGQKCRKIKSLYNNKNNFKMLWSRG